MLGYDDLIEAIPIDGRIREAYLHAVECDCGNADHATYLKCTFNLTDILDQNTFERYTHMTHKIKKHSGGVQVGQICKLMDVEVFVDGTTHHHTPVVLPQNKFYLNASRARSILLRHIIIAGHGSLHCGAHARYFHVDPAQPLVQPSPGGQR